MSLGDATVQVLTRTRFNWCAASRSGVTSQREPCSALRGRTGVRCVTRLVNSLGIDCTSRLAAIPFWPQRIT